MIIIAQVLIKYALFEHFNTLTALDTLHFIVLVTATVCIAAAGNIINDIYDIVTDNINKPNRVIIGKHISEQTAYYLFFTLNIIGVVLGFYLSHHVGKKSVLSHICNYLYYTLHLRVIPQRHDSFWKHNHFSFGCSQHSHCRYL